jgi:tetratricopeptide (TPR) repeat protein
VRPALALGLGAAAVLGAVAARNYAVSGELVLTTAQAGQNFYFGNNELANGRAGQLPFVRPNPRYERADFAAEAERRTGRAMSPTEVSRFWFGEALHWLRANPGRALALQWLKLRILFYRVEAPDNLNFDFFQEHLSAVLRLPLAGFWLAGPFGFAGLVLALVRRRAGLLGIYVIAYCATLLASFILGRYRMALVPALLVFAAHALVAGWEAWRHRQFRTLGVLAASCAVAAGLGYPRWTSAKFDVAWSRLGSAHLAAGNYEAAVESFANALAINPRLLHACLGLGQAHEALQDEARALAVYRRCAEVEPASAEPHLALGVLHLRAGRTEQATAELERALALDPANPRAREALRRLGYEPSFAPKR